MNASKGTLKVRGTKANVLNFLLKGLKSDGYKERPLKMDKYNEIVGDGDYSVDIDDWATVQDVVINMSSADDEEARYGFITVTLNYSRKNCISAEKLALISEKYGIDLKIYAFERGMAFNQDIEVIKGCITRNDTIRFEDYEWECTCPEIGG